MATPGGSAALAGFATRQKKKARHIARVFGHEGRRREIIGRPPLQCGQLSVAYAGH
jgi:hypothetical protein